MPLRSFTDAEILVSERRRLERPLVVVVWLGVALFSLAERDSSGTYFLIAGTVAAGIKLQAISRGKELYLRRFLVNAGVLLATVGLVLGLALRSGDPARDTVVVLGHYAILIQLCKLFERAKNRDYVEVLLLNLLTVMTACLFTDQLWFALAVGAYLALACYTVMVLTLKRGLDVAAATCLPTEAGPLPADKVAWNVRRNWPGRALRWQLLPVLTLMLATGALFYVVTPRTRLYPGLIPRQDKNSAETGFAGRVQLGDAKSVTLSDRVALKVRLSTAPGESIRLKGPVYLRGSVLEDYGNSAWSPRGTGGAWKPRISVSSFPPEGPPPPGILRQEISSRAGVPPPTTLFGMHPSRRLWIDPNLGSPMVSSAGDMRIVNPPYAALGRDWMDYAVDSLMEADANEESAGNSGLTDIKGSVREMARGWCRDLLGQRARPENERSPARQEELDLAIAQRIAESLRNSFKYSLDLSSCNPNIDGVEDFILNMKQGHCEYFASAMTVMCRALDVRARLATGFRMDEFSGPDGWVEVRDLDAHAWTEVYAPSKGWVVYDATPGGLPAPVQKTWWSALTQSWDDAHQFWSQRVIRYSEQDRRDLVEMVRGWMRAVSDWASRVWEGVIRLFSDGYVDQAVLELAFGLGALAAVAEVLVVVRLIRRKTHISRSLRKATGERWRQVRFLQRLLTLLERHELGPLPEMSLLETVRRGAQQLRLPAEQAEALAQLYYRIRWGREDLPPDEIASAEATVDGWATELSRRKRAKSGMGTGE